MLMYLDIYVLCVYTLCVRLQYVCLHLKYPCFVCLSVFCARAYVYGHGTQRRLPAAAAAMAELVTTALAHLVAMESAAVVQVSTRVEHRGYPVSTRVEYRGYPVSTRVEYRGYPVSTRVEHRGYPVSTRVEYRGYPVSTRVEHRGYPVWTA
jgi:hypothetical protein